MDPLQEALKRTVASRTERFQAVLNAVAGEARFRALKEEIERKLSSLQGDLERGWVRSEDLAARVVAIAGQEVARAEQALRRDLASSESVARLADHVQRAIEDALSSSRFFDQVSEVVGRHLAEHEKRQPHPVPRELAGLIVETVREVFADGQRLTPEEIAQVAKVQAESTVQKALTSQLWAAEVSRLAAQEASRVSGEHAKRLQEELGRLARSVGSEGLRQLETPEGKGLLEKLIRAAVNEVAPSQAALEAAVKERIQEWAASEDWRERVSKLSAQLVRDALDADPRLKPDALASSLKSVVAGAVESLRKEAAQMIQEEAVARGLSERKLLDAVSRIQQASAEAEARLQKEIEAAANPEALRRLAAEEVQRKAGVSPDALREIVQAELRSALPTLQPQAPKAPSAEEIAAAVLSGTLRQELQGWIRSEVADELQAALGRVEETAVRCAEEATRKASAQAGGSGEEAQRAVREALPRLIKEELRPLKEALLSALPAEIQNAVETVVERQGTQWAEALLGSQTFVDAVLRVLDSELSKRTSVISLPESPPEEAPARKLRGRVADRGTIREHFLALREKGRWKGPER